MKIACALFLLVPAIMVAQQGNQGVGIILGFPTGVTGAVVLSPTSTVAVHAGWSLREDYKFHATGTYQFMFPYAIRTEEGKALRDVVPYLGVGGRLLIEERQDDTKVHVGLRVGGGVEYFVSRFGFFLELFPVVDLIPKTEMDFEGGVGARIYF
ncbi:hypothetical protein AMJ87_13425 [candidate division WOR_3 bacterium SM23_60]|uniref:Outer membrane protein beta-barrel domain-containing protein n=1 Tax=candidate division WOR_3 bacterium SM23_60 TaxID=1703780 RepID=A0A0S8G489_UNCW3|nr:MAG: hypothetical protein AMJ87_13425 [candidate division WOR_3 bacterium SM23_60]